MTSHDHSAVQTSSRSRRAALGTAITASALAAGSLLALQAPAEATAGSGSVNVLNVVHDGDSTHTDSNASILNAASSHHIVYSDWGVPYDWSMDIRASRTGLPIVTPFGSNTANGHPVESKVVDVRPGCKSGRLSDGGYVVKIEAKDKTTGAVLARAALMHVDREQVSVGQVLGPWTTIGYTNTWGKRTGNTCYQDTGSHVHLEIIDRTDYSCWHSSMTSGRTLTDLTAVGRAGTSYSGQRARC